MSLHYETPVVLIEFSTLEAFSFKVRLLVRSIRDYLAQLILFAFASHFHTLANIPASKKYNLF